MSYQISLEMDSKKTYVMEDVIDMYRKLNQRNAVMALNFTIQATELVLKLRTNTAETDQKANSERLNALFEDAERYLAS